METFARLYKMHPRLWPLSIVLLFALAVPAMAQEGYTPPPMFDIPEPLPPANGQKTDPLPPARTQPRKISPVVPDTAVKPAPVKKSTQKSVRAPVPEVKPQQESTQEAVKKEIQVTVKKENSDIPKPGRKPPVPQKYTKAKVTPAPSPATEQPKASSGVVTGPKTMPAVPAQDFEAETVYHDDDGQLEGAILKRHTEAIEHDEPEVEVVAPEVDEQTLGMLSVYTSDDGQAQKVTIPLAQGQTEVTTKMLVAVQAKSHEILAENPSWRLQILSYATPFDQGQSSDRRMSLNRALSVRDALLQQEIEARKIDVRALGDKTKTEPKDRIDLIFYAPDTSPDTVAQ